MATDNCVHATHRVIYAKEVVGLGTQFGPYPGKDAKERKFCEWMAFVGRAKSMCEANLTSYISEGQKYFRSCKIIQPYETFMVWDDDEDGSERETSSSEEESSDEYSDVTEESPTKMTLRKKKTIVNSESDSNEAAIKSVETEEFIEDDFFETPEESILSNFEDASSETSGESMPIAANSEKLLTSNSTLDLTCSECNEEFVSPAGFILHKLLHREQQKCTTCHTNYTSHENLRQHILSHASRESATCNQCFRYFEKEFDLTAITSKVNKTSLCVECESIIVINQDITIAKEIAGQLTCNYCGRVCNNRKCLTKHLNKHNSKYSCRKCGKVFGSYYSVTRHLFLHTNLKPFKCKMCGKMFAKMDKYRYHTRNCRQQEKSSVNNTGSKSPMNGISVEKLKDLFNSSSETKVRNTRSLSRSKLDSLAVENENNDALNEEVNEELDEDVSASVGLKVAENFHCPLEETNGISNGNITFPPGNEQTNSSHRSSSRSSDEVAVENAEILLRSDVSGSVESCILASCNLPANINIVNSVASIDKAVAIDEPSEEEIIQSNKDLSEAIKTESNCMTYVPIQSSFNINEKTFHDCSVKITTLYDCNECDKVYASVEGLAMHSFSHLIGQTCTKCGNDFALHRRMRKHLLTHSSDEIKDCLKCDMLFGIPFNYYRNYTRQNKRLLCDECDPMLKETHNQDMLMEINQSGLIKCKCGETFLSMKSFQNHFTVHLTEFSCNECKQYFLSCGELKDHMSVHVKCQNENEISANVNEGDCTELKIINKENGIVNCNVLKSVNWMSDKIETTSTTLISCSGVSSKVSSEDENTTFHYECSQCMRKFESEAGTALHMLLHMEQFCTSCGDCVEQGFDWINNDKSQYLLLCAQCKRN